MQQNNQTHLIKKNHYLIQKSYTQRNNQELRLSKSNPQINCSNRTQTLLNFNSKNEEEDLSFILKSSNQNQLQAYKFQSKNPFLEKLEKIQDLVFQKKLKNVCKYNKNTKIHNVALPVPKGTCSIMLNKNKNKNQAFNISTLNKKLDPKVKYKMKWKTIQWLIQFRKDAINQMFKNYQYIVKFAKQKHKGLTKQDFYELMVAVGMGSDINLLDKLFYVFDEDSNGTVDYKELIIGLEIFKEDSIEEKIKVFFDICDADGNGSITEKELYDVLKTNIVAFHDRIKLKKTIHQIFIECDQNGDGVLDKEEILEASKTNVTLRQLLQQSINDVKQIDKMIENDLKEPFNEWVPASANFINYKEGIFYPYNDKIIQAFKEMEEIKTSNSNFSIF
ncbi:unnamed protein product [Paramecium sonneborni]|uniref:EF-hand domain-containing protein n=1 Tax=Paramecium sonneborni TaxID=65129 RepID=A0A8S1JX08_9CILI|nr:unnamed protein product [Paramecium sonneborni]